VRRSLAFCYLIRLILSLRCLAYGTQRQRFNESVVEITRKKHSEKVNWRTSASGAIAARELQLIHTSKRWFNNDKSLQLDIKERNDRLQLICLRSCSKLNKSERNRQLAPLLGRKTVNSYLISGKKTINKRKREDTSRFDHVGNEQPLIISFLFTFGLFCWFSHRFPAPTGSSISRHSSLIHHFMDRFTPIVINTDQRVMGNRRESLVSGF